MKTIVNLMGWACLCVFMTACRYKIETFNNGNASGGELRSPFQNVFAHISEKHYLKINGKTYRGVAGGNPYCLEIPELHSVLFVTGNEDNGSVKFHIVNRETGREAVINGGQLHFGGDIGAPRKPGEPYTDFVLMANSNELTLASQGSTARMVIVLNLSSNIVERVTRETVNPE